MLLTLKATCDVKEEFVIFEARDVTGPFDVE